MRLINHGTDWKNTQVGQIMADIFSSQNNCPHVSANLMKQRTLAGQPVLALL